MNLDDNDLRRAMLTLADDHDPAAEIQATIDTRLGRRRRIRRTVTVGALAAAVVAIVGTVSVVAPARQNAPVVPAGSSPSASSSAAPVTAPPASSGAPADSTMTSSTPTGVAAPVEYATTWGTSARCYASAEVGRPDNRNYISVTLGGVPRLSAQDAVELCRTSWLDGTLSTTEPHIRDRPTNPGDTAVPDLVACVLPPELSDEGIPEIAIIPGDESTCTGLSLPVHQK